MTKEAWLQFLQTVIFPAAALAATGVVGILIAAVKKVLDKNTAVTVAAADDQAQGFKDIGKWRYEMNERLARMEERTDTLQRRVERIPTGSQWGYRRTNPASDPMEETDKVELTGPTPPKIPPVKP